MVVTAIPIRRDLAIRRGHYRARFHGLPDFTLLVPIQFTGHFTFGQLAAWPENGKWKELVYIPAPRRPEQITFRF